MATKGDLGFRNDQARVCSKRISLNMSLHSSEDRKGIHDLVECFTRLGPGWHSYYDIGMILPEVAGNKPRSDITNSVRNSICRWNTLAKEHRLGANHDGKFRERDDCESSGYHRVCIRTGSVRLPGVTKGRMLQEARLHPEFSSSRKRSSPSLPTASPSKRLRHSPVASSSGDVARPSTPELQQELPPPSLLSYLPKFISRCKDKIHMLFDKQQQHSSHIDTLNEKSRNLQWTMANLDDTVSTLSGKAADQDTRISALEEAVAVCIGGQSGLRGEPQITPAGPVSELQPVPPVPISLNLPLGPAAEDVLYTEVIRAVYKVPERIRLAKVRMGPGPESGPDGQGSLLLPVLRRRHFLVDTQQQCKTRTGTYIKAGAINEFIDRLELLAPVLNFEGCSYRLEKPQ